MGTVVHTCRSRIVREEGPTRKAIIEGFPGEVRYGVLLYHALISAVIDNVQPRYVLVVNPFRAILLALLALILSLNSAFCCWIGLPPGVKQIQTRVAAQTQ